MLKCFIISLFPQSTFSLLKLLIIKPLFSTLCILSCITLIDKDNGKVDLPLEIIRVAELITEKVIKLSININKQVFNLNNFSKLYLLKQKTFKQHLV